MQFKTVAAAALLAASVSAYDVLTPTLNTTLTKGESVSIEWTSVDTDAEVFSVYLANFATHHWPPTVLSLAQNVPRGDKSISLRIPCDVSSDYGWQINFINGTNTYVIYAQSDAFFLTGDCVEPTPEPTPSQAPYGAHSSAIPYGADSTAVPYPTGGYSNHSAPHPTGPVYTTKATSAIATATLCTSVQTVVYATPIVWFVEPSKEASCHAPPPKETAYVTVTVTKSEGYEGVHTGYQTKSVGGGEGGYPVKSVGAQGGYPTKSAGGEGGYGGYPSKSVGGHGGYAAPTGTGAPVKPTKGPVYTGAASSVRVSGAAAMIVGALAFLL